MHPNFWSRFWAIVATNTWVITVRGSTKETQDSGPGISGKTPNCTFQNANPSSGGEPSHCKATWNLGANGLQVCLHCCSRLVFLSEKKNKRLEGILSSHCSHRNSLPLRLMWTVWTQLNCGIYFEAHGGSIIMVASLQILPWQHQNKTVATPLRHWYFSHAAMTQPTASVNTNLHCILFVCAHQFFFWTSDNTSDIARKTQEIEPQRNDDMEMSRPTHTFLFAVPKSQQPAFIWKVSTVSKWLIHAADSFKKPRKGHF